MTSVHAKVLQAACELARNLSTHALERLCCALEELPHEPTLQQVLQATHVLVGEDMRDHARKVLFTWRENADYLLPQSFAWTLRGAASADAWCENQQRIEPVWTGPRSTPGLRRTDAALIEVIDFARARLWIVTFAAYRVPPVMSALQRAASRGVQISFVGEDSSENDALMSGSVSRLRKYLPSAVTVYIWPLEKRLPDEKGNVGALHAKIAIADGKVALISSANLTGHALRLNMEAGTLIYNGAVPLTLEAQLSRLADDGTLKALPE